MAINIQKLTERLQEFKDGEKMSEMTKCLWKPKEGLQTVRIVPYKHNPENPFVELKFYYKLAGQTYLAPCTFGKPDPIMDVIEQLRASGSNEEKEIAAKLMPQARTYAPVLVRGEEERGVRFWGFGITVYKQLLQLMTNTKWGDITSWTEGNDIDVEFHKDSKKKNAQGKSFPETIITPCPQKTPVVDPSRRDLMEKLKDQHDLMQVFPLKSYDELKAVVEKWLYPDSGGIEPVSSSDPVPMQSVTQTKAPVVAAPATTAATPVSTKNMAESFANFFDA